MSRSMNEVLARCLEAIHEGRMTPEDCIRLHPEQADAITACLELSSRMNSVPKAVAPLQAQYQGQQRMFAALAERKQGEKRSMVSGFSGLLSRAAAVVVAGSILAAGGVGAAAFSGSDVADQVLETVGLGAEDNTSSINNAPDAAEVGKEHAADAAFAGAENANAGSGGPAVQSEGGLNNAPDAAEMGKACASENAFEGAGNAEDKAENADAARATGDCPASEDAEGATVTQEHEAGINNAPAAAANGVAHANSNAFQGQANSEEKQDNASPIGQEHRANAGSQAPTAATAPVLPTQASANAGEGAGNAGSAGQAASNASLGSGNAPVVVPTPGSRRP